MRASLALCNNSPLLLLLFVRDLYARIQKKLRAATWKKESRASALLCIYTHCTHAHAGADKEGVVPESAARAEREREEEDWRRYIIVSPSPSSRVYFLTLNAHAVAESSTAARRLTRSHSSSTLRASRVMQEHQQQRFSSFLSVRLFFGRSLLFYLFANSENI